MILNPQVNGTPLVSENLGDWAEIADKAQAPRMVEVKRRTDWSPLDTATELELATWQPPGALEVERRPCEEADPQGRAGRCCVRSKGDPRGRRAISHAHARQANRSA
jgi:hypothetical protein